MIVSSLVYVPFAHRWHTAMPVELWKDPEGQEAHSVWALSAWYLPTGHGVQSPLVVVVSVKEPRSQA